MTNDAPPRLHQPETEGAKRARLQDHGKKRRRVGTYLLLSAASLLVVILALVAIPSLRRGIDENVMLLLVLVSLVLFLGLTVVGLCIRATPYAYGSIQDKRD